MKMLALISALVLPWPLASAAPWIQADGEVYVRGSVAREEVAGLQAWRTDAFAEIGITDHWTVSGKAEAIAYDEAGDFNAQGWRVAARRRLFQQGNLVASVEVGALQGAAIGGLNGCQTLGAELRGGLAWSGRFRKAETFAFAEAAGRMHDGCSRERLELGFGQQATRNIWAVTQVWIERGETNADSDKIQTELIWRQRDIDVSVGYRSETGGTFEEDGVFFAVARRF